MTKRRTSNHPSSRPSSDPSHLSSNLANDPASDEAPHSWVIDRIEDAVVTVEVDGGAMISVPVSTFPNGVHEGDVFRVQGDTVTLDQEAMAQRMARSRTQVSTPSKNDVGGDIAL